MMILFLKRKLIWSTIPSMLPLVIWRWTCSNFGMVKKSRFSYVLWRSSTSRDHKLSSALLPSLAPPPLSTSQFLQDVPDGAADVSDLTLSRKDSTPSDAHNRTLGRREALSPPPPPRTQQLNSRQIKDFEQRLGFLDPEDTIMENIKRFLMLNRNAYKLLDLFQRLRDLGQPSYIALPLISSNLSHDQPQVCACVCALCC